MKPQPRLVRRSSQTAWLVRSVCCYLVQLEQSPTRPEFSFPGIAWNLRADLWPQEHCLTGDFAFRVAHAAFGATALLMTMALIDRSPEVREPSLAAPHAWCRRSVEAPRRKQ